jgi:hypothetical protein
VTPVHVLMIVPVLLLGACARIPDEGPVVDGAAPEVAASAAPFDFSPPGPEPGATPEQVVAGFLTALQATPLSTSAARQFLTARAAEEWQPEARTLLYGEQEVGAAAVRTGGTPVTVPVTLDRVFALDATGRWAGRQRAVEAAGLSLQAVREQGEWRLADPPDALVLPLTHFENRYRRLSVYFTDPTGTVLVPEPVYLPLEVQAPTQLVEALLAGPRGDERVADRTFVPPGTELVVSVPVDSAGVAQVPLTGEVLELGRRDLTIAVAQLVWTLRQVPEVTAVRVTVDSEPVAVPDLGEVVPVGGLDQYSPLLSTASTDLYGLRGRTVRRVTDGRESTVLQLPRRVQPVSLAVSILGNPFAVADAEGRVHVVARGSGRRGPVDPVETVETGPAAKPSWDWSRALWLVPRRFDGTVQVLLGGRLRSLAWPDPTLRGGVVRAMTVSRDGSRLVLALSRPGGSVLALARVTRSPDQSASPVALRAPSEVRAGSRLPGVVALGWRDELTLAVLVRRAGMGSRVLGVPVDGQRESRTLSADSDVLFGRGVAMAASPVSGEVRVTTREGGVHLLSEQGRWRQDLDLVEPLQAPTFVG